MKVLILGGTGAMGVHLTKLLDDSGIETIVTSRTDRSSHGNVSYIKGNAQNEEFLKTLLNQNWDVIVDFMVYRTIAFRERVNLLLQATSQYIFLSSARVYAGSEQPLTENSPLLLDTAQDKDYLATDEYALAKAMQENALRSCGYDNWTIIRPYITYSENRLQLGVLEKEDWLYRAMHGRTIIFSRDIASKLTTLTYGLDVAKGISAVIGNPEALGQTFHITTTKSIRWGDVLSIYLDELARHLGRDPKVLLLDLEDFQQCCRHKYQIHYDRLFNREFDNGNIFRYIDTGNFTHVEAGLRNCARQFFKAPEFKAINWGLEAMKDRKSKERTSLNEIRGLKQKIKYLVYRYLK